MLVRARVLVVAGLSILAVACGGGRGQDDGDAGDSTSDTVDTAEAADVPADGVEDTIPDGMDVPDGDGSPDVPDVEDADSTDPAGDGADAPPDVEPDEIADAEVADSPTDLGDGVEDSPGDADGGADPPGDAITDFPPDLPGDGDGSISGVVRREAALLPGSTPDTDAAGSIIVVLYSCSPFDTMSCATGPLQAITSSGPVDLHDASTEFAWEFRGLAPGYYSVFAALDDDGSGFDVEPWTFVPALPGDLATFPPEEVYVFTGSAVTGVVAALGVRASRLSGVLTLGTGPGYSGDGLGDAVVAAMDVDPSSGGHFTIMGLDVIRGIDMADASPDAYETVLIAPAGTVYVSAYLDDDGSGGSPAHGDPAVLPVQSITVPAMGSDLTLDLLLDGLVP